VLIVSALDAGSRYNTLLAKERGHVDGRRQKHQSPLWIAHHEIAQSPGTASTKRSTRCCGTPPSTGTPRPCVRPITRPPMFRAKVRGPRPLLPDAPRRLLRRDRVGAGLEWRFADSLSLRSSWASRSPARARSLDAEPHPPALAPGGPSGRVRAHPRHRRGQGVAQGPSPGVDSTYLRADASMKAIVRRDTRESYAEFVLRLATEAGAEHPTAEEAGGSTGNARARRRPTASGCRGPIWRPALPS